jgi:hypothetical protein
MMKLMSRDMSCNANSALMKLQVSEWGKTTDNGINITLIYVSKKL